MLDKDLIKRNFKKSITTYSKNAAVQKKTAQKLTELVKAERFKSILEIGSYTGLLTSLIHQNFSYESYLALDIIEESNNFIQKIDPSIRFQNTAIEDFKTDEKFDLIISNASLQWCENLNDVILKLKSMLNPKGVLALTLFDKDNLFEIKEIFNISLNYLPVDELKPMFSLSAKFITENYELNFNSPLEALRHLKLTGVNSIQKNNLSIKDFKLKLKEFDEKFQNKLTYKPIYIID